MSWGARRLSKPMEALISSMISAGPLAKRPPHIRLLMSTPRSHHREKPASPSQGARRRPRPRGCPIRLGDRGNGGAARSGRHRRPRRTSRPRRGGGAPGRLQPETCARHRLHRGRAAEDARRPQGPDLAPEPWRPGARRARRRCRPSTGSRANSGHKIRVVALNLDTRNHRRTAALDAGERDFPCWPITPIRPGGRPALQQGGAVVGFHHLLIDPSARDRRDEGPGGNGRARMP